MLNEPMFVFASPQLTVSLPLVLPLLSVSLTLVFPLVGVHLQLSLPVAILAAGGPPLGHYDTEEGGSGCNENRPG
jgi:hypothetical protein